MKLYAIRRPMGWKTPEDLAEAAQISARVGDEEMSDDIRWIRSYVVVEADGSLGNDLYLRGVEPGEDPRARRARGPAGDGDLGGRRHGDRPRGPGRGGGVDPTGGAGHRSVPGTTGSGALASAGAGLPELCAGASSQRERGNGSRCLWHTVKHETIDPMAGGYSQCASPAASVPRRSRSPEGDSVREELARFLNRQGPYAQMWLRLTSGEYVRYDVIESVALPE